MKLKYLTRNILASAIMCLQFVSCGKDAKTERNSQAQLQISQSRGISILTSTSESLISAIKKNELISVKMAIKNQADVNYMSSENEIPLVLAAQSASTQITYELIKAGADPHLANGKGQLPLFEAIKHNQIANFNIILNKIKDINQLDDHGDNALLVALNKKHNQRSNESTYQFALQLMIKGIDIHHKDSYGKTAIEIAYEKKFMDIYQILKDIISIEKSGVTQSLMQRLIRDGQIGSLKYIGAHYKELMKESLNGANFYRSIEQIEDESLRHKILRLVLSYGLSPNGETDDSEVPLISAVMSDDLGSIKILVDEYGANIEKQNEYYLTALVYAAKYLKEEIANFLYLRGAQVEYYYTAISGNQYKLNICKDDRAKPGRRRSLSHSDRRKLKNIRSRLGCD